MKILALDTSTKFLTLGLYAGEKFYDYNMNLGRKHSSLLAPTIKRVIGALGWKMQEIDYFACGLGPGSFTGVRIGVSTIKGMAFGRNQPVVGISSLDILARNAQEEFNQKKIVPVLDARRGLLYYSIYSKDNNRLRRMIPYRLASKKEFFKEVKGGSIILGDGLECCLDELHRNSKRMILLDKDYWYPKANQLVRLAQERIKEGELRESSKIKPIYLYPKECQIK